jgi:hypothetical protein
MEGNREYTEKAIADNSYVVVPQLGDWVRE